MSIILGCCLRSRLCVTLTNKTNWGRGQWEEMIVCDITHRNALNVMEFVCSTWWILYFVLDPLHILAAQPWTLCLLNTWRTLIWFKWHRITNPRTSLTITRGEILGIVSFGRWFRRLLDWLSLSTLPYAHFIPTCPHWA